MKAFVIFAVILVVALVAPSHQAEDFANAIKFYRGNIERSKPTCLKVANVKLEIIDNALDKGDFAEDPDFKCFLKCFLEFLDVFDDKGEVIEENFKKHVGVTDEAIVNGLYQKCGGLKGADQCATGFDICKCVYQSAQAALKSAAA